MIGASEIASLPWAAMAASWDIPHGYLSGLGLLSALAAMGLGIGVLSGLFGVGGGFMVVPLLSLAFGLDYRIAVGSSLAFTVGTGAGGLAAHWRAGNVAVKTMLIIAGGAVCGAPLGGMLVDYFHDVLGPARFTSMMDVLFIALLAVVAGLLLRRTPDRQGPTLLQMIPLPTYIHIQAANLHRVSLPGLTAVGLLSGLLSGMMGVGGGVILVPLLMVVVGLNAHQAIGTSLGVVLLASISGTIKYGLDGSASLWIAMALLVGSALGVQVGVWLCRKLGAGQLRRWFAILVIAMALALATRQLLTWIK